METFWRQHVTQKLWCFLALERGDFSKNSDIFTAHELSDICARTVLDILVGLVYFVKKSENDTPEGTQQTGQLGWTFIAY